MSAALGRVRTLVEAARRIGDAADPLGAEARAVLPGATGLSAAGVALALSVALESRPTERELRALLASVRPAPRTWVLLSANVFTAAFRAIALGLAASADVHVRPSRREPEMARLLAKGAPGSFSLVDELRPVAGDLVIAYGRDETLASVARSLPPGVRLSAHGSGLGVALVRPDALGQGELGDAARRLAVDVTLFDQRGCLSPRAVLTEGSAHATRRLAEACAAALADAERRTPLGALAEDEIAARMRYGQTMAFAGDVIEAGRGMVGLVTRDDAPLALPPPGRNLHVARVSDATAALARLAGHVAAVGVDDPSLGDAIGAALPDARRSPLGAMQTPPLDGPVDRRTRERVMG